jgi:hypothetical protein
MPHHINAVDYKSRDLDDSGNILDVITRWRQLMGASAVGFLPQELLRHCGVSGGYR